jgi:hypothetical protein
MGLQPTNTVGRASRSLWCSRLNPGTLGAPVTSLRDALLALTKLKQVGQQYGDLRFFTGNFWSVTGPTVFLDIARQYELDLCMLKESEEDEGCHPPADFAFFATHIYTPLEWGWRVGPSFLWTITDVSEIIFDDVDIVGACEATVLFLARRASLETSLRALAMDASLRDTGLSAVAKSAAAMVGSSCHSGDFLWISPTF